MALMWIIHLQTFELCLQRLIARVISGQRGLRFTLIFFFFLVVRRLKLNQFIPKSSWPGSQINQLVRVHRELSGACADFRDSSGSDDDDDAGDDDGGGTVVVEGAAAAPSSCHTNLWLNSGCVCPTGFFLTPKLSHAFWSPLLPSFRLHRHHRSQPTHGCPASTSSGCLKMTHSFPTTFAIFPPKL